MTGKVHAMIKQIAGYEDNDVTVINGGAEFLFEFKTLEDFCILCLFFNWLCTFKLFLALTFYF